MGAPPAAPPAPFPMQAAFFGAPGVVIILSPQPASDGADIILCERLHNYRHSFAAREWCTLTVLTPSQDEVLSYHDTCHAYHACCGKHRLHSYCIACVTPLTATDMWQAEVWLRPSWLLAWRSVLCCKPLPPTAAAVLLVTAARRP